MQSPVKRVNGFHQAGFEADVDILYKINADEEDDEVSALVFGYDLHDCC